MAIFVQVSQISHSMKGFRFFREFGIKRGSRHAIVLLRYRRAGNADFADLTVLDTLRILVERRGANRKQLDRNTGQRLAQTGAFSCLRSLSGPPDVKVIAKGNGKGFGRAIGNDHLAVLHDRGQVFHQLRRGGGPGQKKTFHQGKLCFVILAPLGYFATNDRRRECGGHFFLAQGFDEVLGTSLGRSAGIHLRDYGRNPESRLKKREDGERGHVDFAFLHAEIFLQHADLPIERFVHVANAFGRSG